MPDRSVAAGPAVAAHTDVLRLPPLRVHALGRVALAHGGDHRVAAAACARYARAMVDREALSGRRRRQFLLVGVGAALIIVGLVLAPTVVFPKTVTPGEPTVL